MKAVTIDRFASPAHLHDVAEPQPEANAVVFRVTAAGVNPVDWKIRDGQAGERSFPLILGQDFAGVVERAGSGVTRVRVGDRIFGIARAHGAYAEVSEVAEAVQDSPFTRIPDGVSDAQAAALPTPALTALASLEALKAGAGTALLIVGAAGSVGGTAVQLARKRNAAVTAVVKSGQESGAREYGAATVVTLRDDDDVAASLRSAGANAFDAVLDLVSDGDALEQLAPFIKPGGALVTTIHAADETWFRDRSVRAANLVMSQTPQSSPDALHRIADLVAAGELKLPVASERPLAEANIVLDEIKGGKSRGKIVLRP